MGPANRVGSPRGADSLESRPGVLPRRQTLET
jgi:hypothetical protein